jgi:hypothetical protein
VRTGQKENHVTPKVQRWFRKCELQKNAVLTEVASWPPASLAFRPSPEAWSAASVLDHLVKVEESLLAAIRKNLPDGHAVSRREKFGSLMVLGALQLPTRIAVPKGAKLIVPDNAPDLQQVRHRWNAVRVELDALLRSLEPRQLRRGLSRHPISGWMDVARTLQVVYVHARRHQYQLTRLKKASQSSS